MNEILDLSIRCCYCGNWVDLDDAEHAMVRLTEGGIFEVCHDRCLDEAEQQ